MIFLSRKGCHFGAQALNNHFLGCQYQQFCFTLIMMFFVDRKVIDEQMKRRFPLFPMGIHTPYPEAMCNYCGQYAKL